MDYAAMKPQGEQGADGAAAGDAGVLNVEEGRAHYGGGGGSAVAGEELDPDGDWGDEEGGFIDPERAAAIKNDPEYIAWEAGIFRMLLEDAENDDGEEYPLDEVVDEILRDIENGTI